MTTTRFMSLAMSLAALLVTPVLTMAELAKDDAARESNKGCQAASTETCECRPKEQAKPKTTAEVPEWVRQIWSSP